MATMTYTQAVIMHTLDVLNSESRAGKYLGIITTASFKLSPFAVLQGPSSQPFSLAPLWPCNLMQAQVSTGPRLQHWCLSFSTYSLESYSAFQDIWIWIASRYARTHFKRTAQDGGALKEWWLRSL